MLASLKRLDIRASVSYGIVATLWILLSDSMVSVIVGNNRLLDNEIGLLKGLGFVFVTTIALFTLLSRELSKRKQIEQQLEYERDNSPVATLIVNLSGTISYANHQAERLLRLPLSLIIGQPYRTLMGQARDFDGVPIEDDELRSIELTSREPVLGIRRAIFAPDGTRILLEMNAAPLFQIGKTLTGFMVSLNDVTVSWMNEKRLIESEKRFRLLFKSNPHPMWVFDLDTLAFLEVNEAAVEHYGYSQDEFLAMRLTDICLPPDIPKLLENRKQPDPSLLYTGEWQYRLKNGQVIDAELTSDRLEYAGRQALLVVSQDITKRKQAERELRLKSAALGSAANAIVITDTRGVIEWINPAFTALTGYTSGEALGHNLRELLHSGQQDRPFYENMWGTILAGNVWHGELINRRKNGTLYTEEQTITSVQNEFGEITHFIGIKQDVTERKRAELAVQELNTELEARVAERTEQLRKIKNRIEAILNSNADPVIYSHVDGSIEQVNPAFTSIFGYTSDEIVLRPLTSLVKPLDALLFGETLKTLTVNRQTQQVDLVACCKDGEMFDASMNLAPVIDDSNQMLGFVLTVRNITNQNRMLHHAMDLSELKSRYVAMAAHDLRNPMSVILSTVDTLQIYSDKLSAEKKEARFTQIKASIKVMMDILNDVLTMGQVESGKFEFNPAPLNVKTFCETVVEELLQGMSATTSIHFSSEGISSAVYLDVKLLRHILENLLSNAIKYSPANSTVIFTARTIPEHIEFQIKDYGIGIPKDDQVRMFETFHRARNAKNIRGTGLGLAIVKQSVDLHGGTITFESAEGQGTTFTVTLPTTF